jgi:hypothetical protein
MESRATYLILPSAGNCAGTGGVVGSDAYALNANAETLNVRPARMPILQKFLIVSSQMFRRLLLPASLHDG